jgi:uncharacterized protein DUF1592/uncharacterized protein DUF1588/uncharacterized protein DUF1595/uncharacterized protein DUF1585/uncharacterized protein DUF1587
VGTCVAIALTIVGCYRGIDPTGASGADDGDGSASAGASDESGESGSIATCDDPQVETSPARRLTRWEYNNTVHDLLGDDTAPADSFSPESLQLGFTNGAASTPMSAVVVEDIENAALALAAAAVVDLPGLLGCDTAVQGNDACADDFIARFGRRAFRRPLTDDELAAYQTFQSGHETSYGFAKSIEMVVAAMLQSPSFLYRVELGMPDATEGGAVRLTSYETATRLSYLLWGTMPDDALLDAAQAGELETPEQVRAMAEQMIDDDRGARALQDFHVQWAKVASVATIHKNAPEFTPAIGDAMLTELRMFVDDVVRDGDGTLATLLTSPVTFVDPSLATFYGLPAPAGTDFTRTELDPTRASGILTQGALLSVLAHEAQPSPVYRGKFVLEQLLCSPPPPPPDDVDTSLPAPDPTLTLRQQLEQLTSVSPCSGCHSIINPPGFAFDHYDAVGRWRDDDRGLPIDTTGKLMGTDVDGEFADHVQLASILAGSAQVRECMAMHWFHYAYGRGEGELDACSTDQLTAAFEASNGDIRGLLLELTQTPAFLYRTDPSAEGGA